MDGRGIGYVSFGDDKNWERELAKELRGAEVPFDPGDVLQAKSIVPMAAVRPPLALIAPGH
ncbi:hypothetical protein NKH36_04640 [Mesorhizobium sp. M1312]|uniref:hypothetical protein n=1 Tax=unclassified Mesorhizobium TaxID=325217 RepID=UPI00333D21E4